MKKDYEFVKRVVMNSDNKMIHYPALKQLIKNFEEKWNRLHGESIGLTKMKYHLKSLLWWRYSNND